MYVWVCKIDIDINFADLFVYGSFSDNGSDCALNALAIDEPLEYARLYLDGTMQMWVDAEDSLEIKFKDK